VFDENILDYTVLVLIGGLSGRRTGRSLTWQLLTPSTMLRRGVSRSEIIWTIQCTSCNYMTIVPYCI
jgi:hypothetical protein